MSAARGRPARDASSRTTACRRLPLVMLVSTLATACGAKTGLKVPELEAGPPDATLDAAPPVDAAPPECTVLSAEAQLSPLDVFMLVDASGSMQEPASDGDTKWRAVRQAVARFFRAPESRGIGVALTYFPIVQPDVPVLCEGDEACGAADACVPAMGCLQAQRVCNTDLDCEIAGFPGDSCVPIGYCPGLGEDPACALESGFECPSGTGPCVPLGICDNRDTCDAVAYRTPDVGVAPLPMAAPALLRSYDRHEVSREQAGGTPTLPALRGVLEGATGFSRDNPTHKIVLVLATDGFPTSCDPDLRTSLDLGVGNVAEAAGGGLAGGVQTFVIGVFGPTERDFAQLNLDRIARSGGTDRAFIVNTASDVSGEFLEALNQVRLDATACEFGLSEAIPTREEPAWVRITLEEGELVWARQVAGADECLSGGFYFSDPSGMRIALCPGTCALLGASSDRELDVFTVCPDDPTGM